MLLSVFIQALEWMAERSPQQEMVEREAKIKAIEQLAEEMKTNGTKNAWFEYTLCPFQMCSDTSNSGRSKNIKDPALRRFAKEVHGPMMELLAKKADYHDRECVSIFKTGSPIVGKLTRTVCCMRTPTRIFSTFSVRTGNGKPIEKPPTRSVEELCRTRHVCCIACRGCVWHDA